MNAKPIRQFIDTNVLVYAHDRSAGMKHEQAKALISHLWQSEEGCLSVQVLQEFYVTVTNKVAIPLPSIQALDIIASLGTWRVHSPTADDIQEAIRLHTRYQISFWDAMIVCSALRLDCHRLWSEDLNAGQEYGGIHVANPFTSSLPPATF